MPATHSHHKKEFCRLTSNCPHLRLMMATSDACRGATCCFTVTWIFLVLFHCSGSSYFGKNESRLETSIQFLLNALLPLLKHKRTKRHNEQGSTKRLVGQGWNEWIAFDLHVSYTRLLFGLPKVVLFASVCLSKFANIQPWVNKKILEGSAESQG